MKSFRFFTGLLLCAMILPCCTKEEFGGDEAPADGIIARSESIAKTSLSGDSNVVWDGDEVIKAYMPSGVGYDSKSITAKGTSAIFTFKAAVSVSKLTYAVYPSSLAPESMTTAGTFAVTLPSDQSPRNGSFNSGDNMSVGKIVNQAVEFKNIGSLLKVKLICDNITKIELSLTSAGTAAVGTGTAVLDNSGNVSVTAPSLTSGQESTITMSGSFTNGGTYCFLVYPGTYSGIKLTFTNGNGATLVKTISKSFSFSRNDNLVIFDQDISDFGGKTKAYEDLYDPISDKGQYTFPCMTRTPTQYFEIVDCEYMSERNTPRSQLDTEEKRQMKKSYNIYAWGLQAYLLGQSICGLVNRKFDEGKTDTAIWMQIDENQQAYKEAKDACGHMIGQQNMAEIACNRYNELCVKDFTTKYVLTDIDSNPESGVVATVAAHVYDALIIDVQDKDAIEAQGFTMVYDARSKKTSDAWSEFKSYCSNEALILMPVNTGEWRAYAIMHKLFVINLNSTYGSGDQANMSLLKEVLAWLKPGAPVFGFEQGVGEDVFTEQVTRYGALLQPADWSWNQCMLNYNYKNRQQQCLANVVNPKDIDFSTTASSRFASYMLTDGDNLQWIIMNSFVNDYYNLSTRETVKMNYEMAVGSMAEFQPGRIKYLMDLQPTSGSIIECFGGGYFYADLFGDNSGDKDGRLAVVANIAAQSMRQHRVKVLHLISKSWCSDNAQKAYQAFIDANDQLEGIVTVEYSPYTAGHGAIYWFVNKQGYHIPVISESYCLWANNTSETNRTGTDSEVGNWLKNDTGKFNIVGIHAWSSFSGTYSSDAARRTQAYAGSGVTTINMNEMIWRVRQYYYPDETQQFINTYCN